MSNKISRRNFLHTAGLGTLGAAAAGLLTACGDKAASGSVASSAAAGTYTAGTYSATATGINTTTPVTVAMTFSADAITDVQIDVANETKGYGADIADEMVKKILEAQSSEVDGHSGATITSGAIKKAAESCINQAKGVAVAPTEASKAETVVPDGLWSLCGCRCSRCARSRLGSRAGRPCGPAAEAEHRGEPGQLRLRHHQVQVYRGRQEDVGAHDQRPVRLAR